MTTAKILVPISPEGRPPAIACRPLGAETGLTITHRPFGDDVGGQKGSPVSATDVPADGAVILLLAPTRVNGGAAYSVLLCRCGSRR